MKRYIKINGTSLICSIFSAEQKSMFDGSEIEFDDLLEEEGLLINGKSISDSYGNYMFKYVNNVVEEIDDNVYLENYKENKINEICLAFEDQFVTGKFLSTSLNAQVDCRRNDTKNDLQNVYSLISKMTRDNLTTISYRGVSDTIVVTKAKLQDLAVEMEDYGLEIYNKKWNLLGQVNSATTVGEINSINW